MRIRATAGTVLAVFLLAAPAWCDGDAILGIWQTQPEEHGFAHIEIRKEGSLYHGEIAWLSEPNYPESDPEGMAGRPKKDRMNPDEALRDRPILGLRIVRDFEFVGDNQWKRGRIYDPSSGKSYRCNMKLLADGTLKVRGFIGISLLGRSTVWVRPPSAS